MAATGFSRIFIKLGISWLTEQQREKDKETFKNKEVDELIDQLKKVEITPQKDKVKVLRKPQKWTFFQLDKETKEDQKDKKDKE